MPHNLPPDAIVVRGGKGSAAHLLAAAELAARDGDGYVLSVAADAPHPGETREELITRLCQECKIRHTKVRTSTVGELETSGFSLHQTYEPASHHDLVLVVGSSPQLSDAEELMRHFEPERSNPWLETRS